MWGVFAFFCGMGCGVACAMLAIGVGRATRYDPNPYRAPRADLPPATARAIRRMRQANRLQVRFGPQRWLAPRRSALDEISEDAP